MRTTVHMKDVDTGATHKVTVEIPEHSLETVRVTFGNSFSVQLDIGDAHWLAATLNMASHQAQENEAQRLVMERSGECKSR